MDKSGYIWLILAAAFVIVEAFVPGGVLGWLAAGAVAAFAVAAFGGGLVFQIIAFAAVAAVIAVLTMPLIKKLHSKTPVPTNADRVIGRECVVREEINNAENRGAVLCGGQVWSARSSDGSVIEKDVVVRVLSIEGVKLIVQLDTNRKKQM